MTLSLFTIGALVSLPAVPLALGVLLLGVAITVILDRMGKPSRARPCAIIFVLLSLLAIVVGSSNDFGPIMSDPLARLISGLLLAVTCLSLLSLRERNALTNSGILLSAIGMLLAASADDFLLIVLGIELATIPTYALVALGKTPLRMEAATKYFVVGLAATAMLVLGALLLTASGGTTRLDPVSIERITPDALLLVGIGAFVAGLAFKLGLTPFNLWIPDAYQMAPAGVSALLAGGTKKAAFAALLRVSVVFVPLVHSWALVLAILAAVTMTVPNLIALWQNDARRMVAYSIMTHAGFLLLGVALGTGIGASATALHMVTHTFMAIGALLVLGTLAENGLDRIEELRGVGYRNPFLAFALTIFLFSLAGIPLLSGFVSKLALFIATAKAGATWLVALAVLNSVIALYYYFRIIRALYTGRSDGKRLQARRGVLVAVAFCVAITLVLGLYPWPMLHATSWVGMSLGLP